MKMKKWLIPVIIGVVIVSIVIAGIVAVGILSYVAKKERMERRFEENIAVENRKPTVERYSDKVTADESKFIGEEKAKEIALDKAELKESDVKYIAVQLDNDDGVWQYEVEFKDGHTEYSADISAVDGKILEWDVDLYD